LQVLKSIDLDVNKGDVVAILGPSGSGKTTMLRCLNFLEKSDGGTMLFDDQRVDLARVTHAEANALRRRTGFVFQSYNLFANKTALQNVTEGLIIARKMPRRRAEEIARAALVKVGMDDRADYYPSQLSGGQQQRVAIARALALHPDILCFDEPTSALDPELTGEVLRVLRELAEHKTTMIIVTHEMKFARDAADRILFMDGGVVVEQGDAKELIDHPAVFGKLREITETGRPFDSTACRLSFSVGRGLDPSAALCDRHSRPGTVKTVPYKSAFPICDFPSRRLRRGAFYMRPRRPRRRKHPRTDRESAPAKHFFASMRYYRTAMHSISTSAPFGSAAICTQLRAGKPPWK
jgi:ABC-type polar amino acid transport system ATPase subunit